MTLDEFKVDFLNFLDSSNVNLGRKGTKTRNEFIDEASQKFESYKDTNVKKNKNPMGSSVKCIKPKDNKKGLSAGKGVHAMTSSESMRADEQLNRSPFSGKNNMDEENE